MPSNKKLNYTVLIGIIIIGLILISIFLYFGKKPESNLDAEQLAKCLTEKGAAMYGAYWCSHCQNQKKLFGDAFQYIVYVECTENEEKCTADGIGGYPTWKINGLNYPGEKTFEELKEISGC